MEKSISVMLTNRSIVSCNACLARNYESSLSPQIGERVNELYDVDIGRMTVTLCKRCLERLSSAINVTLLLAGKKITFEIEENGRPPP